MGPKIMTTNEKAFYSAFKRTDASNDTLRVFAQSKKDAVESFLKFKLQAQDTSHSEEAHSAVIQPRNNDKIILDTIRAEDEKDDAASRSLKIVDQRKIKINKVPIEQKPDHKLKNKVIYSLLMNN
jgi:hypothetical protein